MPSFEFNSQQKEAIKILEGPLLISAGAGSGKTQVLTTRIAQILIQKKAQVDEILACTFTHKAAREMSYRVLKQIEDIPIYEPLWLNTFHSIASRILRENIRSLAPRTSVIIYDSADQIALIKKVMKDHGIDTNRIPPKNLKQQIGFCKRKGLSPQEVVRHPHFNFTNDFPRFYNDYEEALIQASAFDFEGLLLETYKLFLREPAILSHYQKKFKFISVDEYQDTNHIQYLLIKMLAQKNKNICVVGDEDQSIYSWRGADISNILNFEKDFPNCKIIKLEQNYRSTQTIVSAATSLISRNTSRIHKQLFTQNHEGDSIQVQAHWKDLDEAQQIARTITSLCEKQDFCFEDFSIFYRTNSQSRILEDQLRRHNIPYKILGNVRFYDRAEVKDMISYLRFLLNFKDEIALRRILNSPRRGIGKISIEKANQNRKGVSLYESLISMAQHSSFSKKINNTLLQFHHDMNEIRDIIPHSDLSEVYEQLLEKIQYREKLKLENTPESKNKIDNINELGHALQQFEEEKKEKSESKASLEEFLEQISLVTVENVETLSAVHLMTLHLSKGLEFNVVFITGLEEGLFPLIQSSEDLEIEEERRLAYVGMTRARKKLFLSYAKNRKRFGVNKTQSPSRFLKEISQNYLTYSKNRLLFL